MIRSRKTLVVFLSLLSMGVGSPLLAHHGGGLDWQSELRGPITGVVSEFLFRFPHVLVFFDVTDEHGDVQNWAMTTRWTPTVLGQHGWSRSSIRPGDSITVMYAPHVRSPTVGSMRRVEVNGESLQLEFEN